VYDLGVANPGGVRSLAELIPAKPPPATVHRDDAAFREYFVEHPELDEET